MYKRQSKSSHEEYSVNAVEIVTIGRATFLRSTEVPYFLLPAQDYYVCEVKETRVTLKSEGVEKGIKIGRKEEKQKEVESEANRERRDRKRKKNRNNNKKEEEKKVENLEPISPVLRERLEKQLIPPPPTLISETLARYKELEAAKEVIEMPPEMPLP